MEGMYTSFTHGMPQSLTRHCRKVLHFELATSYHLSYSLALVYAWMLPVSVEAYEQFGMPSRVYELLQYALVLPTVIICSNMCSSRNEGFRDIWLLFSKKEKRNLYIYIIGIMLYKFAFETFNGSVTALATTRYDDQSAANHTANHTYRSIGLLTGLNQACQCIGAILVAPLEKRLATKMIMICAMLAFGLLAAILLVVERTTGGVIKPQGWDREHGAKDYSYYGHWDPNVVIAIQCLTGISYGMLELGRRVIPLEIVGIQQHKLRLADSLVHVFYELAGTAAAFITALVFVPRLGNNFVYIATPCCSLLAALVWWTLRTTYKQPGSKTTSQSDGSAQHRSCFRYLRRATHLCWLSAYEGCAIIVLSGRKYIWLLPCYSFALYMHHFLPGGIGNPIAQRYLGNAIWQRFMVGGNNLGAILGALIVLLAGDRLPPPLPWLRLDAVLLLVVWYLPFWHPPPHEVGYAWLVGATFVPISAAWALGELSLQAYIQASTSRLVSRQGLSAPAVVMSFLYCVNIVMYAISSPLLGGYVDRVYNATGGANGGDMHRAMFWIAGVQSTVIAAIMLISTLLPLVRASSMKFFSHMTDVA